MKKWLTAVLTESLHKNNLLSSLKIAEKLNQRDGCIHQCQVTTKGVKIIIILYNLKIRLYSSKYVIVVIKLKNKTSNYIKGDLNANGRKLYLKSTEVV